MALRWMILRLEASPMARSSSRQCAAQLNCETARARAAVPSRARSDASVSRTSEPASPLRSDGG